MVETMPQIVHVTPPMCFTVIHLAPTGIGRPCPVGTGPLPGSYTIGDVVEMIVAVGASVVSGVDMSCGGRGIDRASAKGISSYRVPAGADCGSKLAGGADASIVANGISSSTAPSFLLVWTLSLIVMIGDAAMPMVEIEACELGRERQVVPMA